MLTNYLWSLIHQTKGQLVESETYLHKINTLSRHCSHISTMLGPQCRHMPVMPQPVFHNTLTISICPSICHASNPYRHCLLRAPVGYRLAPMPTRRLRAFAPSGGTASLKANQQTHLQHPLTYPRLHKIERARKYAQELTSFLPCQQRSSRKNTRKTPRTITRSAGTLLDVISGL